MSPPATIAELQRKMSLVVNDMGWSAKWSRELSGPVAALRALVEEWRKKTPEYSPFDDCADELEAILGKERAT